jgi:hypothetical protein
MGSFAHGYVNGTLSKIIASGDGAIAGGYAD